MKNVLKNCTPEKLFYFFEEISDIPRGSGNEKGIADYLEGFAKSRGLYCKRDAFNNVFIRKPAARGREKAPSVLFQAHTDMVCIAREGKTHNFTLEGPELLTDGRFIFANGTTLGADNGAGVAVMLALIDDTSVDAPETEYLFTSCEETGMDGANGFDYSEIRSELIINLDSEEEFNACIGCAGGIHIKALIPSDRVRTEGKICSVELDGLVGGHSGVDIDKGRSSGIKLLALALNKLYSGYPFHIVSFSGGTRDNVIPSSAKAVIAFADNVEAKKAKLAIPEIKKWLLCILSKDDRRAFSLKFSLIPNTEASQENTAFSDVFSEITEGGMLSLKSTSTLISALILSPQGVTDRYVSKNGTPGAVSGSVNLGIAKTADTAIELNYLIRSSETFFSQKNLEILERLSHLCRGKTEVIARYPGWASKEGEYLQALYADCVRELFGKPVVFSRVHAGLECGIIFEKLREQGLSPEIISVGPNNENIHTPNERLDIGSLERLYKTAVAMIEKICLDN